MECQFFIFQKRSMPEHCHHQHSGDCSHHTDNFEEEMDPCMAQEVAQAEKNRIVYGKLKAQSDRMLMNLNIRTGKMRVRGCVAPEADALSSSSQSGDESLPTTTILKADPSDLFQLCRSMPSSKMFSLAIPCDVDEKMWTSVSLVSLVSEFESLNRLMEKSSSLSRFSILSKRVCVCGKCEDPASRLAGSLRSIAMVLRGSPSIVFTRNGGMMGIWAPATPEDNTMEIFVRKNL